MSEMLELQINANSFDGVQVNPSLMSQATAIDAPEEPTESKPETVPSIFDEDEGDMMGELICDGLELVFQVWGHPKFEINESKRAMLEAGYSKLAIKYGTKAPGILGNIKEEVMVIILMVIVIFGGLKQIKSLRAEDEEKAIEGGDNGAKSKRAA
ncbi:hypothetical protein ACXHPE_04030 [Vibrio cincinnatiensis]|jgi:hypothetical protein